MATPFFTLIIPLTEKISYLLPFTLDSLAAQKDEASFEVIIVDGTGRKSMLTHLPIENATVLRTDKGDLAFMLGEALKIAKGKYIHILNPGEFYIFSQALAFMAKIIHGHAFPDLIYTPRKVRHYFGQPTIDLDPLTIKDLKQGEIPPSLQSFWLRRETVLMLRGFREKYRIHYGYDLICRMFLAPTLRKAFVRRILTDYEYRSAPPDWVWKQSLETIRISFKHFGPTRYLLFWILQNGLKFFHFSWKSIRASFWKKHATF